jgi:hypothetical protein
MRVAAIAIIILVLGCIGVKNAPEPAANTTTEDTKTTITSTSSLATTTSTSTTTTTLLTIPECDKLAAIFWRALCYDDRAYRTSNPGYCKTVYCRARLVDSQACGSLQLNATDWSSYKEKACEAWAANTTSKCRDLLKSSECFRWYTILAGNDSVCKYARNTHLNDCNADFAYWRGDIEACASYKTMGNRFECESHYYEMVALDRGDPWYCNGIKIPKVLNDCKTTANWTGHAEKHPLYGLTEQLLGA